MAFPFSTAPISESTPSYLVPPPLPWWPCELGGTGHSTRPGSRVARARRAVAFAAESAIQQLEARFCVNTLLGPGLQLGYLLPDTNGAFNLNATPTSTQSVN